MEKYFTHAVGYPFDASPFYKDSTPSGGGATFQFSLL